MTFPIVVTAAGAQPTPPATLLAALIGRVTATNPGYTANLPGSLIEDVSSTEVAGLAVCDAALVETINSMTPFGANAFLLLELGQIYIGPGSAPAVPTNTAVYVVFLAFDSDDNPLPGQVIAVGFTVSDGTYQYVVQDGGITDSNGVSPALYCVATVAGSWAVATNTVDQIITSVPDTISITCTNPNPGISGGPAETEEEYRTRVMQAGQAIATGTATLLKTLIGNVSGVQQRLISVRQKTAGWEVIVGGGDPYEVAGAIFDSGVNIAGLVGSSLSVTNITKANPGVVTTDLNHGYSDGQAAEMTGIVGMTPLNGVPFTVTVVDEKHFSIGISTLPYPDYESGGAVTPNLRNVIANISDPPDVYSVPFVVPPQQTVTVAITYTTTAANFTSQAAVAQLAAPAVAAYITSIRVGAPMSELLLESTFAAAVASVLDPSLISSLTFAVSINGISTAPVGKLISGDPESYFYTVSSSIVVSQG